jgi:hypothetical protein
MAGAIVSAKVLKPQPPLVKFLVPTGSQSHSESALATSAHGCPLRSSLDTGVGNPQHPCPLVSTAPKPG